MKYPFHAIIKPVGDVCNLNCQYCFYKEKSEDGDRMTNETLELLTKKYIDEQPQGCKEVQFVWQGGEPMMAGIEFYELAVELQRKYQRPGMTITNAIQTNGTLITERWADFLKQHNFLVGISIDGPLSIHDAQRIYYSESGSHDNVIRGYKKLKSRNITTNILCVIHNNNVTHGANIYRYFNEELNATSIQFLPVVGSQGLDSAHWGEFLVTVFDAWLKNGLGRVSIQLFDATFTRTSQGVETFCVHSHECGRQLAVERNGSVYACDHYVEPSYKLGNIANDNFVDLLNSDIQQRFVKNSTNHDDACAGCKVKGLCQSGCPKHRDTSGKNRLCEGYYRFFTYSMAYNYAIAESLRRGLDVSTYKTFLPQIEVQVKQALTN
ncbi:anaerobic sulfatase maturase [Vibrio sp. RC27]